MRRILTLRYAGLTFREIAEQVGLNERTVRQIVSDFVRDNRDDIDGDGPASGMGR
jgi:predicted transcriptional regulator